MLFAPLANAFGEEALAVFGEKEAAALLDVTQKNTGVTNSGHSSIIRESLFLTITSGLCHWLSSMTCARKKMSQHRQRSWRNYQSELGRSYPANVSWNFWAYAKLGQADLMLKDIRERWNALESAYTGTILFLKAGK